MIPEEDVVYLSVDDVLSIYWGLVRKYANTADPIEPAGVQSVSLLEMVVNRPKTGAGEKRFFKSIPYKGAALAHGIAGFHPFYNGNKRTAHVAAEMFFELNGFCLKLENDEIEPYLLRVVNHEWGLPEVSDFYAGHLITAREFQEREYKKIAWINETKPEGVYDKIRRKIFKPRPPKKKR